MTLKCFRVFRKMRALSLASRLFCLNRRCRPTLMVNWRFGEVFVLDLDFQIKNEE